MREDRLSILEVSITLFGPGLEVQSQSCLPIRSVGERFNCDRATQHTTTAIAQSQLLRGGGGHSQIYRGQRSI